MKHNIKRITALLMCLILTLGMSVTAFAATTESVATDSVATATTPVNVASTRATYYKNHYTNGNSYGTFKITTTGSITSYTVQTQDFPSNSWIVVEVWNADGTTQLSSSYVDITGNGKKENAALKWRYGVSLLPFLRQPIMKSRRGLFSSPSIMRAESKNSGRTIKFTARS